MCVLARYRRHVTRRWGQLARSNHTQPAPPSAINSTCTPQVRAPSGRLFCWQRASFSSLEAAADALSSSGRANSGPNRRASRRHMHTPRTILLA